MTNDNKTSVRFDPTLNHNFLVSLGDDVMPAGGFSECSGLEMTMDPEEYTEGGRNGETLKFASYVKWGNITLKKGFGFGSVLWDWHYGFVIGQGKRVNGIIKLLNDSYAPAAVWTFKNGMPVKYSLSAFNASENNVAIEAIEIAHEGIFRMPGPGAAAPPMTSSELVT